MPQTLCILTDAHHMPSDPGSWQAFITLMGSLPDNAIVVSLGDFFDFWYRPVKDHRRDYDALLECIERTCARGIKFYFIIGNRDFFFKADDAHKLGLQLEDEPFHLEFDREKLCFMHGDLLLTSDEKYQKFRKFIRQGWISALARNLPYFLASFMVNRIRKKTAQEKAVTPIDQFEVDLKASQNYLGDSSFLIAGHTHLPLEADLEKGRIRILPAFGDTQEYLIKEEGSTWELKQINNA